MICLKAHSNCNICSGSLLRPKWSRVLRQAALLSPNNYSLRNNNCTYVRYSSSNDSLMMFIRIACSPKLRHLPSLRTRLGNRRSKLIFESVFGHQGAKMATERVRNLNEHVLYIIVCSWRNWNCNCSSSDFEGSR